MLFFVARNAVVVIICAFIASILVDLYGFGQSSEPRDFLTLTPGVAEGVPTPAVPKFSLTYYDKDANVTMTKQPADIFAVSTLCLLYSFTNALSLAFNVLLIG